MNLMVGQDAMDMDIEETTIEMKRRIKTREQMVQIFVKMDGMETFHPMVSPSDKIEKVIKRIRNNEMFSKSDVYMTCGGRVPRWNDEPGL